MSRIGLIILILVATVALTPLAGASQPDPVLQTLDGSTLPISSLRGKVVVLVFSGIQDPQCRDEFKALNSLGERYQGKEVALFWVSLNPPNAASDDRLKAPCGPVGAVTVLRDPTQAAFKALAGSARQLPTIVIIGREGQPQTPRQGFNPGPEFVNSMAGTVDGLIK